MGNVGLSWYAGIIENDCIYAFSNLLSCFFIVDLVTKEITLHEIPKEILVKIGPLCGMKNAIIHGKYVYFWGACGVGYLRLDLETFEYDVKIFEENVYSIDIIKIDSNNLLIPSITPYKMIWQFSLDTEKMEKLNVSGIDKLGSTPSIKGAIAQNAILLGEYLYFPLVGSNTVLTLNINSKELDTFCVSDTILWGIVPYENQIVLSQIGTQELIIFDVVKKKTVAILNNIFCKNYKNNLSAYSRFFFYKEKLFTFPESIEDPICVYDFKLKKWDKLEYPKGFCFNKKEIYMYAFYGMACDIEKDILYVFQLSGNMLLEIDLNNYDTRGYSITISNKSSSYFKSYFLRRSVMKENQEISLDSLIMSMGE